MIVRILRPAHHAGWVALLAASAVFSACSSNSNAVPETFVAAQVGPQGNGQICNLGTTQQWLDLGAPPANGSNSVPATQKNGSTLMNGNAVAVACTVAPSGNGFDIQLSATEDGSNGGSLVISSPSGQGAVTSTGGSGISGSFESGGFGRYNASDCTIAFTFEGAALPNNQPPIAAGRIWGHISCPHAQQSGKTVTNPDGGAPVTVQCDAEADFLFQECGQ